MTNNNSNIPAETTPNKQAIIKKVEEIYYSTKADKKETKTVQKTNT